MENRILVKADPVLGTPEAWATVLETHDWGYLVHVDGDPDGENGPVDFDGNVLADWD